MMNVRNNQEEEGIGFIIVFLSILSSRLQVCRICSRAGQVNSSTVGDDVRIFLSMCV